MRAAIVMCLVGFAAIIQHGSACSLPLDRVQQYGCIALRYYALRFVSNPPVCGQNRASCGVGIVDKSVKVQDFKVRADQCRIYGPWSQYPRFCRSQDPRFYSYRSQDRWFYGWVTGAHIVLTGRQRINGKERDFKATIQAKPSACIKAETINPKSQCVKSLSSELQSNSYVEYFQDNISSPSSREILLNQLKNGALDKMMDDIISQAPSMLG